MEARYPFVAIDVALGRADELSAALFELGASGVEERDEGTLARGPGAGRVTLVGSFPDRAAADAAIAELGRREPELAPRLEEVVGDAWRDAWTEHFAPFALTPRITVAPPWVEYERARPDELVLHLEPGRAFGTGLHATTALVAAMLDERAEALRGREVLDVGTGSGILALVALMLGASRALAIDNDADVIEVVRENAARNGLADRVEASDLPLQRVTARYPLIVANIEARVLGPMAPDLARVLAPGGTLILSGVLASEEETIRSRYTSRAVGLAHLATSRRSDGPAPAGDDWVALALAAPV